MAENLYSCEIDTPLGPMLAIGNDKALYLLEFTDRKHIARQMEGLQKRVKMPIESGSAHSIVSVQKELDEYFAGNLRSFKTPLQMFGSPFQVEVWQALQKIPFGKTLSYQMLAAKVNKPTAYRAAANANAVNRLAIIIPCHRVIQANGLFGGYAGGVDRKAWLLKREQENCA